MSKYTPLEIYLVSLNVDSVVLTFREIESIICDSLPRSARVHREWWSNDSSSTHVQADAWLKGGWTIETVNLKCERVTFSH